MALKIMREVTEWSGHRHQPNHVYLMSGDKALAYSRWGQDRPFYFRTFIRLDRRGRKFEEVTTNRWKFDMSMEVPEPEQIKPAGQTWSVVGSKGSAYEVSFGSGSWTCSCPGHSFRGRCRHVDQLRASNPQLG